MRHTRREWLYSIVVQVPASSKRGHVSSRLSSPGLNDEKIFIFCPTTGASNGTPRSIPDRGSTRYGGDAKSQAKTRVYPSGEPIRIVDGHHEHPSDVRADLIPRVGPPDGQVLDQHALPSGGLQTGPDQAAGNPAPGRHPEMIWEWWDHVT